MMSGDGSLAVWFCRAKVIGCMEARLVKDNTPRVESLVNEGLNRREGSE